MNAMSKHDITTVCTLAAHLALRSPADHRPDPDFPGGTNRYPFPADRIAVDAMKLQRLGRQAFTNAIHRCNGTKDEVKCIAANMRYLAQATEILKPYGLKAKVGGEPRGCCLHILGLRGHTMGGDSDGFGI